MGFIKKLVVKGIIKIKEIIDEIKKHFFPTLDASELEELNEITCESVLSSAVCTKLRDIAKKLKLKVELIDSIIRQLVKEKITEAKVIIEKVKAKLIELATNFKCSDLLSKPICGKIYEIVARIKVEAKVVDEFIKKLV